MRINPGIDFSAVQCSCHLWEFMTGSGSALRCLLSHPLSSATTTRQIIVVQLSPLTRHPSRRADQGGRINHPSHPIPSIPSHPSHLRELT